MVQREERRCWRRAWSLAGEFRSAAHPRKSTRGWQCAERSMLRVEDWALSWHYLARTLSGAWCRWHPSRTNNGSFVVRALNNFQGGGDLVPGAYINVLIPRTGTQLPRARHCRPLYPRAHGDVFAKKTALRQKKRSFTPLAPPAGQCPQHE